MAAGHSLEPEACVLAAVVTGTAPVRVSVSRRCQGSIPGGPREPGTAGEGGFAPKVLEGEGPHTAAARPGQGATELCRVQGCVSPGLCVCLSVGLRV